MLKTVFPAINGIAVAITINGFIYIYLLIVVLNCGAAYALDSVKKITIIGFNFRCRSLSTVFKQL